MALLIPDYPDPQDAPGVTIPAAYAWIPELTINYADLRAYLNLWVHRSADAAATWPGGIRVPPAARLRVACGDPVPGHPEATFPTLEEVMGRSATIAADMMGVATSPEEQAAALASVATGGAIRASLYAYLRELVFPDSTEVE